MWDRLQLQSDLPDVGDIPLAAVLVALYEDPAADVRVILTKRPDTMPTHAGHIAFPGGRPQDNDEGPAATALREAQEEVGIDPAEVVILGYLPPIHTFEYSLLVVPVVGRLPGVPNLTPSEREVALILEPRLEDLAHRDNWILQFRSGREVLVFDLEGEVLWGATARIIRQLVGLDPLFD